MPGTVEVQLLSAKGLENADFLANMDPYAILTISSQAKKSSVAAGKGSSPEWDETFLFNISNIASDLKIKIMDSDLSHDDFVGEATIELEPLFSAGSIPPTSYHVVKDEHYCGEVRVGLTFTQERSRGFDDKSFGGWKQSDRD